MTTPEERPLCGTNQLTRRELYALVIMHGLRAHGDHKGLLPGACAKIATTQADALLAALAAKEE